jgi:acyl dehydratase
LSTRNARLPRLTAPDAASRERRSQFRRIAVPRRYWEDFAPGQVDEYGSRLVGREEIIAFAAEFDPQPMHLDEAAARATLLGGLSASGWHACCILMRMCTDSFVLNSASMGAPGVDEVRWLIPIRPGDELTLHATVLETRASKSRTDMGFVKFLFELINQSGVKAMTLTTSLMIGRRGSGSQPA